MRLSVNDFSEYDQETLSLCNRVIILLDGKEVSHVVEADEEEGSITRYKIGENGLLCFLYGDEVETETLTGNVQIIDPLEKKS